MRIPCPTLNSQADICGRGRIYHGLDGLDLCRPQSGEEVIVVDVSDDSVQGRWHAQRVMNALRTTLPPEQIAREIVVLSDGPRGDLAFGSSPNAEAFVRSLIPQLSDYKWQSKELDW